MHITNTTAMHVDPGSFGFPLGYFCIKSVSTNRLLDVAGDSVEDGAEVVLWPSKEQSLVETLRNPEANNQVFYIDATGALCSRASGHAIDVIGDHLVLRHRRPVSYPFPNQYSHPLPQFSYDPHTHHICIEFSYSPSFSPRADWTKNIYFLTSVPKRRPTTVLDQASAFLSSAVSSSMTLLSGVGHAQATPEQVFNSGEIDLKEDEILEQDRSEENEVDDSLDPLRLLNVISVPKDDVEIPVGQQASCRRQWEIVPLRATKARSKSITT